MFKKLNINSTFGKYEVLFKNSKISFPNKKNEFYIIDKNVYNLYRDHFSKISNKLIIFPKEENKSFEKIPKYLHVLQKKKIKKDSIVNCIGGGITQDISSFLCSIYKRGLNWNFYPTTLLAQADSCIGSKNSINYMRSKNIIGCFYPPKKVIINFSFLKTLKKKEIQSGIGEILKCGIIHNHKSFLQSKNNYIDLIKNKKNLEYFTKKSLKIKKKIIEIDEFDKNIRKIMNYGHTFGHALESECNYEIPHGIAVNIGMDLANYISFRMGFINKKIFFELHAILVQNFLDYIKYKPNINIFCKFLNNDKKNVKNGYINSILLIKTKLYIKTLKINNNFKNIVKDYFYKLEK